MSFLKYKKGDLLRIKYHSFSLTGLVIDCLNDSLGGPHYLVLFTRNSKEVNEFQDLQKPFPIFNSEIIEKL